MTERYRFSFGEETVYGRVLELVLQYRRAEGNVVVDIGCGYGSIAEPLRSQGLTYIGFDSDPVAIADLLDRSFEAEVVDFSDADHAVSLVAKRLGGRSLSTIVMIDSIEHLVKAGDVLRALQHLATEQGCVPLVLALPNVTHIDLVGKLLLGRWDTTNVGLLDDTHVAFYSEERLRDVTHESGWLEVAAADFTLLESDQHFPPDAAMLQNGAPLRELLFQVRDRSAGGATVNEFVRAYTPLATPATDKAPIESTFLSVLMRTQNMRPATLQEALLSLAAQSCEEFEVLLLPHDVPKEDLFDLRYIVEAFPPSFSERVRIIPVDGGGRSRPLNVGVSMARGRYISILDDDDVVFGSWVASFREASRRSPGRVLRAVAAEQEVEPTRWVDGRSGYHVVSRPYCRWESKFDVVEHLIENQSPPCGWAVPRSAFRDLGIVFDENLPVLEDWDVLMQAVLLSGVESVEEVTALWRRWRLGDSSTSVHSESEWLRARMAVLSKLDSRPLLLPARSVTKLHDMSDELSSTRSELDRLTREGPELDRLTRELQQTTQALQQTEQNRIAIHDSLLDAHRQLTEMRSSTSWKLSKPLRFAGRILRRMRRHRD